MNDAIREAVATSLSHSGGLRRQTEEYRAESGCASAQVQATDSVFNEDKFVFDDAISYSCAYLSPIAVQITRICSSNRLLRIGACGYKAAVLQYEQSGLTSLQCCSVCIVKVDTVLPLFPFDHTRAYLWSIFDR